MKKYLFILAMASVVLVSCSFDDEDPVYDYTSVSFTYQNYIRNIVVGEGLGIEVGVVFSGVVKNNTDRVVGYEVDPTLITDATKTLLPADYYTLGNPSKIIVPRGSLVGNLPLRIDSLKFLGDPKALTGEYVFPIRITSAEPVDSINAEKDYMVISISYFGKQFGNYYYEGRRTGGGQTETYGNQPSSNTSVRQLVTVGPTTFRVVADPDGSNDPAKGSYSFLVDIPVFGDGPVTVSADPASAVAVQQNGDCSYTVTTDEKGYITKTLTLNYRYNDGTTEWTAEETMVYRNRIRDNQGNGIYVNERDNYL